MTVLEPKEITHYNHTYRNCVVQAAIFTWSCKNFWNPVFLSDHESTRYFCRASDICAHCESKHMETKKNLPVFFFFFSLQPFIVTFSLWACWIAILCICVSIRGWWGEAVWVCLISRICVWLEKNVQTIFYAMIQALFFFQRRISLKRQNVYTTGPDNRNSHEQDV